MGADLSRVRFDPHRDHTGVVMQQGRLLLDADWNELVAILQRRLAAQAVDLGSAGPVPGIAGVAVVPRTTPDAFRVTLSGGALTIGRGRMYVDGILAENHGDDPQVFDPLLSEEQGSKDLPYGLQPYWPDPDPLPEAGTHLAYLDVWQREVTPIEAPDLVEPAVGVDTTARTQTAWRVRLHPIDDGKITCATPDADIPGWLAAIAPSGARLTVGTIAVDPEDELCELPPTGGYRGPEHQTYRVEVHDGGAPGAATFKWSRDNGSVVTAVVEVLSGATAVRPASLGRDDVLSFSDGDWVEFLDDRRELTGTPGALRLIEVHEEDGTVSFAPALPADLTLSTADAAARHLRMRRWDQSGKVKSAAGATLTDLDATGASGVIPVPASSTTQVVLEAGLVVSFSSTGADFRVGDHWIFPARAADALGGPIPPDEPALTDAPPLGIHHHYARLGILTFPDGETDCRSPWPDCRCEGGGCGDCTICVTAESHSSGALTIQQAVDEVTAAGGGTVCLAVGTYALDEGGVLIDGAVSLRLHGQGAKTILLARDRGIAVQRSAFVQVDALTVFAAGGSPAVALDTTAEVEVSEVVVLMLQSGDLPAPGILLSGLALGTRLVDDVVIGAVGIGMPVGDEGRLLTGELQIRDNLLVCRDAGIAFEGSVAHLLSNDIRSNTVLRCAQGGLRLRGAVAPTGGVAVADNTTVTTGPGITVGTAGFTVRGNDVSGSGAVGEVRSDGIAVMPSFAGLRGGARIADNVVCDVGGRGIGVLGPLDRLDISGNTVERALHGIVMDGHGRADDATVSHNTVRDVGSRPEDSAAGVAGIRVLGALHGSIQSNTVVGVGAGEGAGSPSIGIEALGVIDTQVSGNTVDRVGFAEGGRGDIGIAVRGRIARCLVDDNVSRRQPVDVEDDVPSAFQGLVIGADAQPDEPGAVTVGEWVIGTGAFAFAVGSVEAYVAMPRLAASVTVDANIIGGGVELPAAVVGVGGDVVVTSNHVHQRRDSAPCLRIAARTASIAQNRLRGGGPSGSFDVDPKRISVVGNLSTTQLLVAGAALGAPWSALNPTGF